MAYSDDDSPLLPEQRAEARLEVSLSVQATGPRGSSCVLLRNLARGGALVAAAEPLGSAGDEVTLYVPTGGTLCDWRSEIVRVDPADKGELVGLRFLDSRDQRHIDELLETLLRGPGGGTRRYPRVQRRTPVKYDDRPAVLQDISYGGVSLLTQSRLRVGDRVSIALDTPVGVTAMSGRVVNVRAAAQACRAGIQFDPLAAAEAQALDAYLHQLLAL